MITIKLIYISQTAKFLINKMIKIVKIMKTIVWFRSDLRVYDNPALKNAFHESDEIHAVFIYSKAQLARHNESNVKIDFLIKNLNSLEQNLTTLNIPLIILNSEGFEDNGVLLNQYAIENSINAVYWNNQFGEDEEIRDKKASKILEESNIRVKNFDDQVVYKPGTLKQVNINLIQYSHHLKKVDRKF